MNTMRTVMCTMANHGFKSWGRATGGCEIGEGEILCVRIFLLAAYLYTGSNWEKGGLKATIGGNNLHLHLGDTAACIIGFYMEVILGCCGTGYIKFDRNII